MTVSDTVPPTAAVFLVIWAAFTVIVLAAVAFGVVG